MLLFTNAMNFLESLVHRGFKKTTHATPGTATAITPSAVAASTLTKSGKVATFTASAAHYLADEQFVTISGVTGVNAHLYNGLFKITVTGATTFTYNMIDTPTANAAGSPVANYIPQAQVAIIYAAAANGSPLTVGPDVNADLVPIAAGGVYEIRCPTGAKFYLNKWYVKSAGAGQAYNVVFI